MAKRKKKSAKKVRPQTPWKGNPDTPNVDNELTSIAESADPEGLAEFNATHEVHLDDDVAGELPSDEDGYLVPPAPQEEGTVVVQDFDPTDPGAPIAEPQKVFKPHDRLSRKAVQRANLEK